MHICYYSLEEKLCSMFCQILPKWELVNLKFKPEMGFHYFTLAFFIEETDFSINPCIVFFLFFFQRCFVQNWELHVQFKVHGDGKTLFGDGFAIWYTKDRMELGKMFYS